MAPCLRCKISKNLKIKHERWNIKWSSFSPAVVINFFLKCFVKIVFEINSLCVWTEHFILNRFKFIGLFTFNIWCFISTTIVEIKKSHFNISAFLIQWNNSKDLYIELFQNFQLHLLKDLSGNRAEIWYLQWCSKSKITS